MGRRFEEKVDVEELARLESSGDSTDTKIRVKMPNKKVNEMFALASQILGGRRVTVLCEDGETRMARIPGKMRRRQWVREGDLIIVWPWDFQDSKADVKHRYTKTQAMYLSRKGVLPDDVDMFGMNASIDEGSEHDDLFAFGDEPVDDATELEAPKRKMRCLLTMKTTTICLQTMAMKMTCLQMKRRTVLHPMWRKHSQKHPLRRTLMSRKKSVQTMAMMTTTSMPCLLETLRKHHG